MNIRIQLAVSACLLGEPVRFDGNHKRNALVANTLATRFDLIPICPEVAIGLGVPRQPIQLTGDATASRVVDVSDPGRDLTEALKGYALDCAAEWIEVDGLILKSGSPSCGLDGVPVHGAVQDVTARGLFAAAICRARPDLPVIDEQRWADPEHRKQFLRRVGDRHEARSRVR